MIQDRYSGSDQISGRQASFGGARVHEAKPGIELVAQRRSKADAIGNRHDRSTRFWGKMTEKVAREKRGGNDIRARGLRGGGVVCRRRMKMGSGFWLFFFAASQMELNARAHIPPRRCRRSLLRCKRAGQAADVAAVDRKSRNARLTGVNDVTQCKWAGIIRGRKLNPTGLDSSLLTQGK